MPEDVTPPGSVTASASRLTTSKTSRKGWSISAGWQEDAWEMYDLVGELRFLAATLALRMSSAKLYVGRRGEDSQDDPEPITDELPTSVLDAIGGTVSGRIQLISRLGVNLFVAGDGYLVGIPVQKIPPSLRLLPPGMHGDSALSPTDGPSEASPDQLLLTSPIPPGGGQENAAAQDEEQENLDESLRSGKQDINGLEWRMLSVDEVSALNSGEVKLQLGETADEHILVKPDDVFLIRIWRSHPKRWWEADSPTRSSLPVLRQIVGLTMHNSAEVDSRLAGAGMLIVPSSASRAMKIALGKPENSDDDPFTDALIEAMLTPLKDRSSASALVPLVATIPDDAAELIRHLSFATPLDENAGDHLDRALRRLALGLDAPPEILLGTAGSNHWGAWLVQDDTVSTHLKPPLALICDALTTQYLWPVLLDQGMSPDQVRELVVWFDVSHLVVRPTASQDALVLHDRGVISAEATRRTSGFDESDAPETDGSKPVAHEVALALELVAKNPSLMNAPGLPQLVAQIKAVLDGEIPEVSDPTTPTAPAGAGRDSEAEPGAGPLPQPGEAEQPGPGINE